ncbi:protein suppressor 2 of zeste-like [Culicoides brevitarsis]|uniref:protein suppressor 2 of zeste-like n=1 Tax=Culicoides brevitarsis TaxID=469753 RepID=UPI00307B3268
MNRINTNYTNNNNIVSKTMETNQGGSAQQTRKPRPKLKAINNFLMCSVCKGYIIDATAISDCLHSFCRSCIVKHFSEHTYCPKCNLQNLSKASLRPDDIINALVYKVVPGLFASEVQKTKKFNKMNNIQTPSDEETANAGQSGKQHFFSPDEPISLSLTYHAESLVGSGIAPPINYLQCPAAVTVHHLKRFVSAKYGINVDRDVNIEIICEDRVLTEEFTLMDVAYCFNWTRAAPLQLMYRIFLQPTNNDEQQGQNAKDIALPVDYNNKSHYDSRKQTTDKSDFSNNAENRYTNTMNDSRNNHGSSNGRSYATNDVTKAADDSQFLVPSTDFKRLRSYGCASSGTNLSSPPKDSATKKQTNVSTNNKSGTVTHEVAKQSEYNNKTSSLPTQQTVASSTTATTNSVVTTSPKQSAGDEKSKAKETGQSAKKEAKNQNNPTKDELKFRIDVDKKCYTNTKKSSSSPKSSSSENKPEIPKLRIELPTIKSKDKGDSKTEGTMPKLILKLPSPIEKRPSPNANVDVKEYAKNIGLLPVSELQERKKRESDRSSDELSHKKRKKAKHSKEPNSKKRKIHAEVSSLTLDDEVKLKVKISKPPSKHEKRHSEQSQKSNEHHQSNKSPSKVDTNTDKTPPTSSILRTVRHKPQAPQAMVFIPNMDKNIPEEQDSISDIVKRVQQPNKSPVQSPKPPQTPPKINSPVQQIQQQQHRASPLQKAASPIHANQNQRQEQKQQQQQNKVQSQLQQQNKPQNPMQKSMSPMEAFQMFQKAQQLQAAAANQMVLMPPFNQASLFDIRMQRMSSPSNAGRAFSPRPTSTSPLSLSMPPTSLPQNRPKSFELPTLFPNKQPTHGMKRPAGSDTPMPMPKTPRHIMDDQKSVRKNVYAPMMPPMKPEPRPVMSKPPTPKSPPTTPQQQKGNEQQQKKPLPRLIAPSSISVTRVGESSQVPAPQSNRPAVEILKIPSTVPAIDQKQSAKPAQKTTRPPPGTIPLFKIQKSLQMGKAIATAASGKPRAEGDKALDLSLSPTGGASSKKIDQVIDLTDSSETTNAKKQPEERQKPTSATSNNSTAAPKSTNGTNKPAKPMMPGLTALHPKNQEMLKNRGLMRQQNLSVRNVPNPSILAFRNQGQLPSLAKVGANNPSSKLNEKVQQLHNMKEQQRQRIAPED